jgi:hypothetical protein
MLGFCKGGGFNSRGRGGKLNLGGKRGSSSKRQKLIYRRVRSAVASRPHRRVKLEFKGKQFWILDIRPRIKLKNFHGVSTLPTRARP